MGKAQIKNKAEGVFVADGDGFLCSDCIPVDLDLGDPDVETWTEYSGGWTGPCVCRVCKLSIPVYVNADAVDIGPEVGTKWKHKGFHYEVLGCHDGKFVLQATRPERLDTLWFGRDVPLSIVLRNYGWKPAKKDSDQ